MLIARIAIVPVIAVVVALGVWAAAGLVTDNFWGSLVLTGLWLGAAGAACLVVARRVRALRWPVLGAYVAAVAAIGVWLGSTTLTDRVVDEDVVTGVAAGSAAGSGKSAAGSGKAAPAKRPAAPAPAAAEPERRAVNVELAAGGFRSGEHATSGRATVVRLADGRRVLTLTGFETSPGPDLRVRLVPGDTLDGGASGHVDLGALKGNRGDQQYALPAGARVLEHSVVVWCRAFSAPFGSALLRAS